nr:hypothetical protein HK105_007107 [Polyrhizophydium stewartii]
MAELGYPFDEPLDAAEDVDAYVDKIGGRAVLPPGTQHADGEPDMRCAAGHPLVLVAQLWAKTPVHSDRFLLVFGCNFGPCSGKQTSWKAFRCIKAAAAPPATAGGPSGAGGQKGSPGQAAGAGGTKGAGVAKAQASSQKPLFAFGAAGDDEWAEDAPAGGIGSASGFEATPAPGSGAGKAGSGTSGAKPPVAEMMELLRQRNQGYSAGSPKPKGKSASVAANVAASAPAKDDEAPAAQGAAPDSQDPPFPASLPALPAYPLEFEREAEAAEAFTHEMRLLEEYKASNPGDAAMLERRQEQVRREASGGGKGDKSDAGEGDAGDEWAGETYERMDVGLDKAFKRFQRRVMQAPEQCIRCVSVRVGRAGGAE